MQKTSNRQRGQVNWLHKRYPDAWERAEMLWRRERSQWPAWCYVPMEQWWRIAQRHWPRGTPTPEGVVDFCRLAALGAWRVTRGIYRFDPNLYTALISTPLSGDLPDALLFRLPSWGVYLETPDLHFDGRPLLGVYAHLNAAHEGHTELRLVLDSESDYRLLPVPVRLGQGSLLAAVTATSAVARDKVERLAPEKRPAWGSDAEQQVQDAQDAHDLTPILSLLLYLCADEADYDRPPSAVAHSSTSRASAVPANGRCWLVGERIGAALRRGTGTPTARSELDEGMSVAHERERAGPRAHWRRAHWHTFWVGPRDGARSVRVKWLAPIPVNIDDPDALPATVRPVRGADD